MRDDGDLRPVARLAGDVGDLDQAVGDLGDLELEQALDQLRVAPRHDDARPLGRVRDLLDDRLDPLRVVVALVLDLLGLGQQRLDALAQLHERVARVRLLDDAGDQLADAVAVLLEGHVALGLADPLQDHLLGGLRGDAAEVVRRDVAALDLVLELGQLLEVELGLGRRAQLPGLRVDGRLLVGDVDDHLVLDLLRDEQLEDDEVARLAVHLDERVLGRARRLLVRGEQRVLERQHQLLGGDGLLGGEAADGLEDLPRHVAPPPRGCNGGCRRTGWRPSRHRQRS